MPASFTRWSGRRSYLHSLGMFLALAAAHRVAAATPAALVEGRGLANASAGVRVGDDRVLIGSDEHNALLLYSASAGGEPLASFDTSRWLGRASREGEADFEGAARIGDTLYWIGSHGRNKDGKARPERQRLLALRVTNEADGLKLSPVGPPVTTLLGALSNAPELASLGLAAAARLAPEAPGGLNIEGLCATPEGGLLVGFRSPVPNRQALLVPLLNPAEFVAGQPARFGPPHQLDLDGRGIRDVAWTGREYFILGGNPEGGGRSRLYRWAGPGNPPQEVKVPGLKELNPEGIVPFGTSEKPRLLILSDDGNRSVNETKDTAKRMFRMMWVEP